MKVCPQLNQPAELLMNQGFSFTVAALMAGRAFVPLDPRSGPEDWRRNLETAGCSLVLFDQVNRSSAEVLEVKATRIADVDLDDRGSSSSTAGPGPESDAYFYFTSGSRRSQRRDGLSALSRCKEHD